ncbi:MAG: DUF6519 domain-containing protein [Burkholderiales bacterium]|nr:DUF6519 domain-containing protein [Burkholderiales bacterium]
MKTQISRITHDPSKRYSGVYLQQGRMIVDADWNELNDIQRGQLVQALADALYSGAPREGGLSISTSGGLHIVPGRLYVEGIPAVLSTDQSQLHPTRQPDYPDPPALSGDVCFYADVWERTVGALEDPEHLMDPGLHGADTATRSQTMLQIKWCAVGIDPLATPDNPPMGNAPLTLRLRRVAAAADACDPCASEVTVDERIGNYLFRVEVHDVYRGGGGDLCIVLKWSRDNGAEAYRVGEEPDDFKGGDWIWEFYDTATEKMLGNHLPLTERRRRGQLRRTYSVPSATGEPRTFVRQWDGYAEINVSRQRLIAGHDRGVPLSTTVAAEAHGKVGFSDDGFVLINLELMELKLGLKQGATERLFVAGDYWLAAVREAVHGSGDHVLGSATVGAPPHGVVHHYLRLGDLVGGSLQPPSGTTTDAFRRRMRFPPLTDLHADEVSYHPTGGCGTLYGAAQNVQQALDALCNLDAADIAYDLKCAGDHNVAGLLAKALGAAWPDLDGQAKTPSVQDMLQALLCHLTAAQLPYTVPGCAGPSVARGLGLNAGGSQVAEVLDRLLCRLDATAIPLDTTALKCRELKDAGATSVQAALDHLCSRRLTPCAVSIPADPGALEQALSDFARNSGQRELWLCLLPGEHSVNAPLDIRGKHSLRITGASAGASSIRLSAAVRLEAHELTLDGVHCRFAASAALWLVGTRISTCRCSFTRAATARGLDPMVRIEARDRDSALFWRDNIMSATWSVASNRNREWFAPDRVGNARVAELLTQLSSQAELLLDVGRMDAKLTEAAQAIAAMPGTDRLIWRDRIRLSATPGRRRRTTSAAASVFAPLAGPLPSATLLPHLNRIVLGAIGPDEGRAITESAIDKINAAGSDIAAIAAIIRDDLLPLFYESGHDTALALGANAPSAAISDNVIHGELLLMNGQERGVDLTALKIPSRARIVEPAQGYLALTGNRVQRLRGRLPVGSVRDNTLTRAVPGYAALTLVGNVFEGFGHTLLAHTLTAEGNQFQFGFRQGELGVFITDNAALNGNTASESNNEAILRLRTREGRAAIGANLVVISPI